MGVHQLDRILQLREGLGVVIGETYPIILPKASRSRSRGWRGRNDHLFALSRGARWVRLPAALDVARSRRYFGPSQCTPRSPADDGLRILAARFRGRGLPADRYDVWMASWPEQLLLKAVLAGEITWREFTQRYREELPGRDRRGQRHDQEPRPEVHAAPDRGSWRRGATSRFSATAPRTQGSATGSSSRN